MTSNLIRERTGSNHHRVAFVELFFDLVFVFAVTQLSHHLLEHLSLAGAAEVAFMTLAVWWVWIYTVWATDWLRPETVPVRLLFFGMMLAGLVLAASIPRAFGSSGVPFALAYVAMQVGRSAFVVWALAGHDDLRRNFVRILIWMLVSGVAWLVGAVGTGAARWAPWLLALGIEFLGPVMRFWVPGLGHSEVRTWNVEGAHMAERCGLFMIIALGESIILTGATLSGLPWTPALGWSFLVAFGGSVAMWWFYFDSTAEAGSHVLASAVDPGALARLAYTYVHLFIVGGIIIWAVGNELVMAHPTGHTDLATATTVLGGAALFMIATTVFKRVVGGPPCHSPLIASAALLAGIPLAGGFPPIAVLGVTGVTLLAVAVLERASAA